LTNASYVLIGERFLYANQHVAFLIFVTLFIICMQYKNTSRFCAYYQFELVRRLFDSAPDGLQTLFPRACRLIKPIGQNPAGLIQGCAALNQIKACLYTEGNNEKAEAHCRTGCCCSVAVAR
jgi:hypothetical protein